MTDQFLASLADAKDITDVNIAAGLELEKGRPVRNPRLRHLAAVAASFLALTIVGDVFAASPVHAGISPVRTQHILVRDVPGADDWGDDPHADVFGHNLPWRAHDGWLMRLL